VDKPHCQAVTSHVYRGHGMDWVDTRAYQAGDDLRHLDWRATARSGKATTKVFQENVSVNCCLWSIVAKRWRLVQPLI